MELPYLNSSTFQVFLDQFARTFHESLNILVLDKSGGHTAKRLLIPDNVRLVWLPPARPELNPIERVWRDLKDALAWQQFADLATQQEYVGDVIRNYDMATLQSLTSYAYFIEAVNALYA